MRAKKQQQCISTDKLFKGGGGTHTHTHTWTHKICSPFWHLMPVNPCGHVHLKPMDWLFPLTEIILCVQVPPFLQGWDEQSWHCLRSEINKEWLGYVVINSVTYVVVYTDLSRKEPDWQESVGRVVILIIVYGLIFRRDKQMSWASTSRIAGRGIQSQVLNPAEINQRHKTWQQSLPS